MKSLDIYYDGVLNLKGEKANESKGGECCRCAERYSGSFERGLPISAKVDQDRIDATYKDGALKIMLTKSEQSIPKKIEVH